LIPTIFIHQKNITKTIKNINTHISGRRIFQAIINNKV
jgi:hypothetical protein